MGIIYCTNVHAFENVNATFVCMYQLHPRIIQTEALYVELFNGPHLYLGIPLFLASILLATLFGCICKFHDNRVNLTCKELLCLQGKQYIEHCGSAAYYYTSGMRVYAVWYPIAGLILAAILIPIHVLSDQWFGYRDGNYADYSLVTISSLPAENDWKILHLILLFAQAASVSIIACCLDKNSLVMFKEIIHNTNRNIAKSFYKHILCI